MDSDVVNLFGTDEDEKCQMPACLPPEVEEGNVEYKLKLVSPSDSRLEHLVTQMKWRLQEGHGEAVYEIGVEDSGLLAGLSDHELDASLSTLEKMAKRLGATTSVLRERVVETDAAEARRRAVEVLVRKVPDDQQFIDLRIAVLGNVDAGKSTLIGVLSQGELDNGRGRARLNLFRHLHEIQSGRTSSISYEILGFDDKGEVVNYSEKRSAEEICEVSSKLITLIDLAGHHKYLKTTIFGLTGYSPDFALLVVSANSGIVGTTKEHLGFALALDVPIFVVVTKTDMCRPAVVERTVNQLEKLLKSPGCKKIPLRVTNHDDAIMAASTFNTTSVTPIFQISSVTGENIPFLTAFLNVLPPLQNKDLNKKLQQLTEHEVDMVYSVPGVGIVVGGTVTNGVIKEGDRLLIGPSETGEFQPVTISSIHRNRMPYRVVQAGQTASLSIPDFDAFPLRKGMVLVSEELRPFSCMSFEASIYLLYHANCISQGFQTTIHVDNVRQTAVIEKMDKESIQTGEKSNVVFRFIKQPEYIKVGSRLLFREGPTKGMGEVTQIFPHEVPNR